jgi:hypothetical protein
MISLTPIVIYPNKTEGIVPYTTHCHAEACKVDQRQERAIVGEPVHRYIDGLKEVVSAFTVTGLTDIQAEQKLTAVMVVYQNDRQNYKNPVTKQWRNSNDSDGTLDTWRVQLRTEICNSLVNGDVNYKPIKMNWSSNIVHKAKQGRLSKLFPTEEDDWKCDLFPELAAFIDTMCFSAEMVHRYSELMKLGYCVLHYENSVQHNIEHR